MSEPKMIFSFVVIEFLKAQGFEVTFMGRDVVVYQKGDKRVRFPVPYEKGISIPIEAVSKMLEDAAYTHEDFTAFCKEFLVTDEFNKVKDSFIEQGHIVKVKK